MIRVLSLGAGVQSSTLLLMSCRGRLPKLDHAIFADTQWEPKAVYEHLEWLKGQAAAAGIPLHVVTAGNLRADVLARQERKDKKKQRASMPLFVLNLDGSGGMIRRQCTSVYKVEPIQHFIKREILNVAPGRRVPCPDGPRIEQWFGISADETYRVRDSRDYWIVNRYPLLGQFGGLLPRLWTRQSCIDWLERNYPDRPIPRSACIGCPFHSDDEWRAIRSRPEEWDDAIQFERRLWLMGRELEIDGKPFLHSDRVPLDEVNLAKDKGQGTFANECEGVCGV